MSTENYTTTLFRHILTGGVWAVSLNPLDHNNRSVKCRHIRSGRVQYVRRRNLVDVRENEKVPNLTDSYEYGSN